MEESVEVVVEFYGYFAGVAGKKSEKVTVSSCTKEGFEEIKRYLSEKYSINQGFMLMVNNESIIGILKRGEHTILTKDDVLKIIPVFSGG